jgi:hypothetical protein
MGATSLWLVGKAAPLLRAAARHPDGASVSAADGTTGELLAGASGLS